jgi:hypothetical protein
MGPYRRSLRSKERKPYMETASVSPPVFDLASATKQLGVLPRNLYRRNLQKLQAICEFRENPLSDNHTLFNDVYQLLPLLSIILHRFV